MKGTFTYDGSFQGLLTVLYDIYLLKITKPYVRSRFDRNQSLFNQNIDTITDDEKSSQVLNKIKDQIGTQRTKMLFKVFLSEHPQAENIIVRYCMKLIDHGIESLEDFSDPIISQIKKIEKSVNRERHRMNAFIRFKEIEKGHYFAICSPDFDVLPLISDHFESRYQDQIWTIYDDKRNYGIHYNLQNVDFIQMQTLDQNIKKNQSISSRNFKMEQEFNYEMLWKTYFDKVNIASRRNTKLFTQHVPKRYRRYLTELGRN